MHQWVAISLPTWSFFPPNILLSAPMGSNIIAHLIFFPSKHSTKCTNGKQYHCSLDIFFPPHILHVNIPITTHFDIHTSTQLVQQYISIWPAERYISVSVNIYIPFWIYRYFIYLIYIYATSTIFSQHFYNKSYVTIYYWL